MHRTVGISPGGGGRGGEPPPRQVKPNWPSHRAPAQERGFSWQEPGWGANPGKGNPDLAFHRHLATHRSPISPTPPAPPALLPRPRGRGQCRRYPRKGRLGMPPPISPFAGMPAHTPRPPPTPPHTPDREDIAQGRRPARGTVRKATPPPHSTGSRSCFAGRSLIGRSHDSPFNLNSGSNDPIRSR